MSVPQDYTHYLWWLQKIILNKKLLVCQSGLLRLAFSFIGTDTTLCRNMQSLWIH